MKEFLKKLIAKKENESRAIRKKIEASESAQEVRELGETLRAVLDELQEAKDKLAEAGVHPTHKEGYADARWVLLDYGDVVAHVFLEEERDFYNLEQLWADAPSESFVENTDD